ncbi:MAG TPA: GGDEF domain-containing protein [Sandaracinaceae bacterium LLY-WYZ-13_1]|nr:GGDEF domain-containing protein [Sandaracinaceae bacterium LLY-WYZ-13_1]
MDVRITPRFQPILDLTSGRPVGWEVLSRGTPPFEAPVTLFEEARRRGALWEIEQKCRLAAIERIVELARGRRELFFLNVSPDVFEDPRFENGFTIAQLRSHGVDPARIVIEITEKSSIADYERFERLIRHYADQGLQFAIDDFGSGHSGLVTLFRSVPAFIKLDRELVRDIHLDPYRQQLVRSLHAFASSVETHLIAEGVERWEELDVLVRIGVRHAQGFLIARPSTELVEPDPRVAERVVKMMGARRARLGDLGETVGSLVALPATVERGSMTVEQLEGLFRRNPKLDHVVVVKGGAPVGLVTKRDLNARTAGPFGYSLVQRKLVETIAHREPLTVDGQLEITALASRAMARDAEHLYDPVVVTDPGGKLLGTVTMRQLITRSVELEVQTARGSNPLTGLPGNPIIEKWIGGSLEQPEFAIVYADLDRFKEYNDRYGFLMGDEVIRLTAQVLARHLGQLGEDVRLGHVGGDDFVLVCPRGVDPAGLDALCAAFDADKRTLFDPEDLSRGSFEATDRRGQISDVPLVTLSLAVIERERLHDDVHPALLGQIAASLKKKVKQRTAHERRSAWMAERRAHA